MTAILRESRLFGSKSCLLTGLQAFYNFGKGSDGITGPAGQNLPWIWGRAPMKRGWVLEVANTRSVFGRPIYEKWNSIFQFHFELLLSPQALKVDWITSLIHILCLYLDVLATRLGHWSTYDSCDDVLQMVAPVVGYRAVSPGGWVGNSTRVGFKFFTISDIRPVLVDLRLGVFGTRTGFASGFLQFPAKVQIASSPVRGMTPLLRQTYLMS